MENRGECSQEVVKENDSGQEEEKNPEKKKKKSIFFYFYFFFKNFQKQITWPSWARKWRTFKPIGALFDLFLSKLVFFLPFGGQQP